MVTAEPKIKLTYEEYINTPEDERWELLEGFALDLGLVFGE